MSSSQGSWENQSVPHAFPVPLPPSGRSPSIFDTCKNLHCPCEHHKLTPMIVQLNGCGAVLADGYTCKQAGTGAHTFNLEYGMGNRRIYSTRARTPCFLGAGRSFQ